MHCDELDALLIDERVAHEPLPADALAHLAACGRCRAEHAALAQLWDELALAVQTSPENDARFEQWLSQLQPPRGRRSLGLIAAGILLAVVAGAAGYQLAGATPDAPTGPQFLLLLHERPAEMTFDPARIDAVVAEYSDWASALAERGELASAEKLRDDGGTWVENAPAPRAEDVVSGFFIVNAPSYEEAVRIARESPHLKYGGRIEVRAIERTD